MSTCTDTMDYEDARNRTLLFFFERLVDKNEPRTLHDLSCQFGAPGFTKEMRQIAGGSQSGEINLVNAEKKILYSYHIGMNTYEYTVSNVLMTNTNIFKYLQQND